MFKEFIEFPASSAFLWERTVDPISADQKQIWITRSGDLCSVLFNILAKAL